MLHAVKPHTNVTESVQVRGSRPSVVLPPAEPTRRIPPLWGASAAGAAVAPPLTIAAETTPAAEACPTNSRRDIKAPIGVEGDL